MSIIYQKDFWWDEKTGRFVFLRRSRRTEEGKSETSEETIQNQLAAAGVPINPEIIQSPDAVSVQSAETRQTDIDRLVQNTAEQASRIALEKDRWMFQRRGADFWAMSFKFDALYRWFIQPFSTSPLLSLLKHSKEHISEVLKDSPTTYSKIHHTLWKNTGNKAIATLDDLGRTKKEGGSLFAFELIEQELAAKIPVLEAIIKERASAEKTALTSEEAWKKKFLRFRREGKIDGIAEKKLAELKDGHRILQGYLARAKNEKQETMRIIQAREKDYLTKAQQHVNINAREQYWLFIRNVVEDPDGFVSNSGSFKGFNWRALFGSKLATTDILDYINKNHSDFVVVTYNSSRLHDNVDSTLKQFDDRIKDLNDVKNVDFEKFNEKLNTLNAETRENVGPALFVSTAEDGVGRLPSEFKINVQQDIYDGKGPFLSHWEKAIRLINYFNKNPKALAALDEIDILPVFNGFMYHIDAETNKAQKMQGFGEPFTLETRHTALSTLKGVQDAGEAAFASLKNFDAFLRQKDSSPFNEAIAKMEDFVGFYNEFKSLVDTQDLLNKVQPDEKALIQRALNQLEKSVEFFNTELNLQKEQRKTITTEVLSKIMTPEKYEAREKKWERLVSILEKGDTDAARNEGGINIQGEGTLWASVQKMADKIYYEEIKVSDDAEDALATYMTDPPKGVTGALTMFKHAFDGLELYLNDMPKPTPQTTSSRSKQGQRFQRYFIRNITGAWKNDWANIMQPLAQQQTQMIFQMPEVFANRLKNLTVTEITSLEEGNFVLPSGLQNREKIGDIRFYQANEGKLYYESRDEVFEIVKMTDGSLRTIVREKNPKGPLNKTNFFKVNQMQVKHVYAILDFEVE